MVYLMKSNLRCKRCWKRIREACYINGKPYGPECAKIQGYSDKLIKINRQTEISDKQWDLFDEKAI